MTASAGSECPPFERREPRFEARSKTSIRFEGRDLAELWVKNLSKTGVFVETAEPPSVGSFADLRLETPQSAFVVRALVVHAIDVPRSVELQHPPGAGLKFVDVEPEKQLELDTLVTETASLAAKLLEGEGDAGIVLSVAKEVSDRLADSDLYGSLSLVSETSFDAIHERIEELKMLLVTPFDGLTPEQTERLEAVANNVSRVALVLLDEPRRLRFDFKSGYVRALERLAEAEIGGRDPSFLREAWAATYPHSFERSIRLAHAAFELSMTMDYELALSPAREALELDPFNVKLRDAMREWEDAMRS
ncbi:MAG: PilZ domain-containing protein [Deltaproteobacteria bacterium]|nr:PilZ domain-containing protein [Deltaproteobacteria bacterium]